MPFIQHADSREEYSMIDKRSGTAMVKTINSKEVIFKYDHFLRSYRDVLWYLQTTLVFSLLAKLAVGIFFALTYIENTSILNYMFLVLGVLYFIETIVNFSALLSTYRHSEIYKNYLIINVIYKFGYVILFLGVFAHCMKIAPPHFLVLLAIPHLLNNIYIWVRYTGKGNVPWFWFPRLILIESLQNLSIVLTVGYDWIHDWIFALPYYYVLGLGWYLASLLMILFIAYKIFFIFYDRVVGFNSVSSNFGGSYLFFFCWNGPIYYYLFCAFNDTLFKQFGLYKYMFQNSSIPALGVVIVVLCLANLIWLVLAYRRYMQWMNGRKMNDNEVTSLLKFFKQIDIELDLLSKRYLKKKKAGKKPKKHAIKDSDKTPLLEIKEDPCLICIKRESNVFVMPCGHKCLCKSCAQKALKEQKRCLACQCKIDKAYYVVYDRDLDQYIGRYIHVLGSESSSDL
jgi:hypothetical protein